MKRDEQKESEHPSDSVGEKAPRPHAPRALFAKSIVGVFLVSTIALAFQNCSNYSESTFGVASSASSTGASDPSVVTFQVNSPSLMDLGGASDNFQVGGTCNTGGRLYNYFQYQVVTTYNPNWSSCAPPSGTVPTAPVVISNVGSGCPAGNALVVPQTAFTRADARCENGRFYLMVPVYCPERGGPWLPGANTKGQTGYLSVTLVTCDSVDGSGNCTNLNNQNYNSQISITLDHQINCAWPGY